MKTSDLVREHLRGSMRTQSDLLEREAVKIESAADLLWQVLRSGKKVLLCGNGGSAADAQHLAAEWVGRYETERRPYPAIALTTDTSALTAIANDYGYDTVFARQVRALGAAGDALIAISTSGNSRNVLEAVKAARAMQIRVVGLTGDSGGALADLSDVCVRVPSKKTAHIQECHIAVSHAFCATVDYFSKQEEDGSRKS